MKQVIKPFSIYKKYMKENQSYLFKVKYLGGSTSFIRAKSPKQAWEIGSKKGLEVIFIKFWR